MKFKYFFPLEEIEIIDDDIPKYNLLNYFQEEKKCKNNKNFLLILYFIINFSTIRVQFS